MSGVPDGWSLDRIGKHLKLQGGYAFKSDDFTQTGIPIVRISNIEGFKVNFKNALFHPEKPSLSPYVLRQGDVLIAMSGATTGKVGQYTSDTKAYLNQRVGRFCLRGTASCSMEFFFQLSQTSQFQRLIALDSIGGAQPNVSSGEIENAVMLWPPIREQRKIADILSAWDEAIEQQMQLLELKRERKRGLMQQLLTGKVRFKEFEGLEWSEVELKSLADETLPNSFIDGDGIESPYIVENGVRLIQTGNIDVGAFKNKNKRYISEQSFVDLKCKEVSPGDVLVCRLAEPAGRACIVPDLSESRMITSVDVTIMKPNRKLVDPYYLVQFMSLPQTLNQVESLCGGSTRSRVSRSNLAKLSIHLPDLSEQQKISTVLSAADTELETLETQLSALRTQKRGLMQQLLTGKTRVSLS